MEKRTWFLISEPPRGDRYAALLDYACARRGRFPLFLLVQRREEFTVSALSLLERLEQHVVATVESDRWPGTQIQGDTAVIRFFRLDRGTAAVLKRFDGLDSWLAPELPEDLCILAADRTPWLVSATRARRFWLHVTDDELRGVRSSLPWLELAPTKSPPA